MTQPKSELPGQGTKGELDDLMARLNAKTRHGIQSPQSQLANPLLERLIEISGSINRIHNRDGLLNYVADRLRELFDASNSFVILFDEDGGHEVLAVHLDGAATNSSASRPYSVSVVDRVVAERKPILIENPNTDERLKDKTSIRLLKISSVLAAPLIVDDEVIGILQFDHRSERYSFPESDLRLLALFADQVATAFANLLLVERCDRSVEETRAAHEYLIQVERLSAIGELATGVAHDFNNSLLVALGWCELLEGRQDLDDSLRSDLAKISTSVRDASETVRRLQEFSRGKQGRSPSEAIDLQAIAQEIPEFTEHKWRVEGERLGKEIKIQLALSATPTVRASATDVRRVLVNLVFNAVDSMQEDGEICISSGVRDGGSYISVRDNGCGMSEKTRKRIFDPFFTTKGTKGVGFGLSTSWSIAKRLHGEVSVESELGEGSVLTLWLPHSKTPIPTEVLETETVEGVSVLLVDDDRAVLDLLTKYMELSGHHATAVDSGEQALQVLAENEFELVIADLGMPGMSGANLVLALDELQPDLPVMLLTGWGSSVELEPKVLNRVAGILDKPIGVEQLNRAIKSAVTKAS